MIEQEKKSMVPKKPSIPELFHSFPSLHKVVRINYFDESALQSAVSKIQWVHKS
jgi:hypothetical protein